VLAGSALDMAGAVRNATASLGIAFDEAARMASAYPADFLGIANATGRIAPGLRADFVVLDDALRVRDVFVGGARSTMRS
jgi:N-acetylglucosamine-6-phosphate deacetylase